ncbi:MAG TPA: glycosyltransferase family 39 protein [Solirubrobacteraceae bacterium]|nr:glycosyltransferase family 39 protein [Solirubrobacteraceae bacterium]
MSSQLQRSPLAPARSRRIARRQALSPAHLALVAILALSAVLNTVKLSQNAWANTFYSAGVKSMLGSLHNFLFASFDRGGLVTIDKPPLGVWVQVLNAKLFGFQPLSLLLPEAIIGTLTVLALYLILARRLGGLAALAAALTLAVFPVFVAVSRANGVDPLLVLLMVLACGAALRSIEGGRVAWLLVAGALIGLAFNTKTLAAYLAVPSIALGYLVCALGGLRRRVVAVVAAGVVTGLVSFSWIALVELTPASQRPFVGSSTNNTEIGLTFEYNGFGRVEGEVGGPGNVSIRPGGTVAAAPRHAAVRSSTRTGARTPRAKPPVSTTGSKLRPNGRYVNPIAFGGKVGPLRLFESQLNGQGAWLLPFAIFGLLALALQTLGRGLDDRRSHRVPRMGYRSSIGRRDPRLATLIVLGGWFAVELVVLSYSKGIVHPYYISALAPGAAAMVGAGVSAFVDFARGRDPRLLLLVLAVVGTVAAQIVILEQQDYLQWFIPFLIVGAVVGLLAVAVRRLALPAVTFLLAVLLVAPTAYATTTWLAPGEGTFPAAGPHEATGFGLYGIDERGMRENRKLVAYVDSHRGGRDRNGWSVLTDASPTAAPLILLGSPAGALGGYGGSDPVLDGRSLARLIARGRARYVVLGGAYADRGGNAATAAVLRDCPQVPHDAWHGPAPGPRVLVLFDCLGREHALEAHPRG